MFCLGNIVGWVKLSFFGTAVSLCPEILILSDSYTTKRPLIRIYENYCFNHDLIVEIVLAWNFW